MLTITGFVYHVVNISSSAHAQIWAMSIYANLIITTRIVIKTFIHIWIDIDFFNWLACTKIISKDIPLHRDIPSSCTSLNPTLHPQRSSWQKQLGSDMLQVVLFELLRSDNNKVRGDNNTSSYTVQRSLNCLNTWLHVQGYMELKIMVSKRKPQIDHAASMHHLQDEKFSLCLPTIFEACNSISKITTLTRAWEISRHVCTICIAGAIVSPAQTFIIIYKQTNIS